MNMHPRQSSHRRGDKPVLGETRQNHRGDRYRLLRLTEHAAICTLAGPHGYGGETTIPIDHWRAMEPLYRGRG